MLGSQGIVVKCTAAIFFLTEDCRGARAADGSWRFTTEILPFCRGKDVTLGTFSVCIYRIIIEAFEFEAF